MSDTFFIKDGVLYKNGEPTICPSTPPVLVPGAIDGMPPVPMRLPCVESCPACIRVILKPKDQSKPNVKAIKLDCMGGSPNRILSDPDEKVGTSKLTLKK